MFPFETGAIMNLRLSRTRPGAESGEHSFGDRGELEARQDAVEILAMQDVEFAERDAALAHLGHGGLIFAAPCIGKG